MAASTLVFKAPAAAASAANVAGTFLATNSGPGDTITSTTGAALAVDGYSPVLGDRLLLKNQTAGLQNGMYVFTQAPIAGQIATTSTLVQPTGGQAQNGTYQNIATTGGTGTGAMVTVVVAGNAITQLYVTNPGAGYTAADVLHVDANGAGFGNGATLTVATVSSLNGMILTATVFTQPSSKFVTNGHYFNFPLTGGTGTGAQATINVVAGTVSVVITAVGVGYTAADVLHFTSAQLGTGGSVVAATVSFTPWVLTRAADSAFALQVEGMAAWVVGGSTNANTAWVQNIQTVTMDTTALAFVELVA